jgi:energy-converting hydrogenase Eha subunit A
VTGIALNLSRADNLIGLSLFINLMMTGLAVSVLAMVLQVSTAKGQFDLVPLSMSLSLIFGLPALRNVQPACHPWERSATLLLLLGRN